MPGAIALLFLLASSEIAAAQDLASQLVGVWKRTDYIRKFADGEVAKPLGETISGMMIFSAGGHFTMVMNRNDRKAGTTDAELAEVHSPVAEHTRSKAIKSFVVTIPVPARLLLELSSDLQRLFPAKVLLGPALSSKPIRVGPTTTSSRKNGSNRGNRGVAAHDPKGLTGVLLQAARY